MKKTSSNLPQVFMYSATIVITAIALVDIAAFLNPQIGWLGTLLWYSSYVFIFLYAFTRLVALLKTSLRNQTFLTVITLSILTTLTLIHATTPIGLSGETTQEINCVLKQFSNSPDKGFRQTCLFGYPSRQYFLPALPSLLFGRSLFALNLGGSLYFLLGLPIFASGMFSYYGKKQNADLITAFCLGSLTHFYYFNHFLFLYEQSIFPLSLGLILVGAYLHYLSSKQSVALIPITLSLMYLLFAYTPAFSLALLGITAIGYSLSKTKHSRLTLITPLLLLVFFTVISLTFREDITVLDQTTPRPASLATEVKQGIEHLLFSNHGQAWATPIMTGLFVITILAGLSGYLTADSIPISLWVLAVFGFAIVSKGYTYYDIPFRLHRAMVTIPVFLLLLSKLLNRTKLFNSTSLLPFLAFFLIQTNGLFYHLVFIQQRQPHRHYAFVDWLSQQPLNPNKSHILVTESAGQVDDLISLNDTLQYFQPRLSASYASNETILEPQHCSLRTNSADYILLASSDPCAQALNLSDSTSLINTFVSKDGQQLQLLTATYQAPLN